MARTRSKPVAKETTPEPTPSTTKPLPSSVDNPSKVFILPKNTSPSSRIVTLDNPATCIPSRYLFCPEKGFYEFTRIAAPKKTSRSWLITSEKSPEHETHASKVNIDSAQEEIVELDSGYITKGGDLFIATPIDILFLILPALSPKIRKEEKQHFLCLDDHIDTLTASSRQLKALLAQYPSLLAMIEKRMGAFCDTVDAGEETMYRLSIEKVYNLLVKKAERMCKNGLPASMEDKFIKPTLEIPIMNIMREESTISTSAIVAEDEKETTVIHISAADSQSSTTTTTPSADSQSTMNSQSTSATEDSASEPPPPPLTTPPTIPPLLRLRTSLSYLTSSYLPPTLLPLINAQIASPGTTPDFTPLTTHLAAIAKLKSEAAALRSISDNISRKRAFDEDEEKVAEREEKKRRKEEEEKKKKGESRAVKQLKKVDTSGMKKMSAFFAKAPAKKS